MKGTISIGRILYTCAVGTISWGQCDQYDHGVCHQSVRLLQPELLLEYNPGTASGSDFERSIFRRLVEGADTIHHNRMAQTAADFSRMFGKPGFSAVGNGRK